MASIFVHLTCSPADATRAALGFLVARTALEDGHEVSMFLAGDAVELVRDEVLDTLEGKGTGRLREHYDAIVARGVELNLSGMSSKARGLTETDLEGKPAVFAPPNRLVELIASHDRTVTY